VKAVELDGIAKVFLPALSGAPFHALTEINLSIAEGEIVGLLGPNGSGKTTLLKIIMGLVAPTAGACRVFGRPSHCAETRSSVGYLPEAPEFYPFLTGIELLRFFAGLAGRPHQGGNRARRPGDSFSPAGRHLLQGDEATDRVGASAGDEPKAGDSR
jgi:ABC-type multidrug transport system ATPase subunit